MKSNRNALVAFILIVTAICFAPLLMSRTPFDVCLFHRLTEWPCPFCRGTRSLAALGKWELKQAVLLNPLVAGSCFLTLIFLPLQIFSEKMRQWVKQWPIGKTFLILLPLNWIYLILRS